MRLPARSWLPVAVWCAVIFAVSSIPSLSTGLGTWDLVLRKAAHVSEYAILGALVLRAAASAPAAFVLGTLYAVSDEIHQSFVDGRRGAALDVVIDAAGVAVGLVAWTTILRRRAA